MNNEDKIKEAHQKVEQEMLYESCSQPIRDQIKSNLLSYLGDGFEVKCDQENNPPVIVDLNCVIAMVIFDRKPNNEYKHVNLVFGLNEANYFPIKEHLGL